MIKLLVVGLWMPLVTMGASYATINWMPGAVDHGGEEALDIGGLDYENLDPVNVPIIADGALQGYVVAKLVFTADAQVLRSLPVPPHPFLVDEAFRILYGDEDLDFRQLKRYDLDALTAHLKESANSRLGREVVQEVLVEELSYFDKDDVVSH